MRFPIGGQL